jgi:hypothetical protein
MNYITILISAFAFALSFVFNDYFFRSFELNQNVSLLFIPSGVRIFFVLTFNYLGAIGILLGSLLVSVFLGDASQDSLNVALMAAIVNSGAALVARMLSVKLLKLDENLSLISMLDVVQICLVFAAVSAVGHQTLFYAFGATQDFFLASLSMFAGDVTGALLCLVVARYSVLLIRSKSD